MLSAQDWHARYTQQARWTLHVRRFLFEQFDLQSAQQGLEVGIGTGAVAADFCAWNAGLRLVGADIDRASLCQARQGPASLRLVQANGLALPYATGSFDFVYCHYLILWLTDPLAVLREMRRVTRPGGAVLALAEPDYTARIDWPSELSILGPLQASALARQGANPAAGRTLAALFHAAGLRQVSTGLLGGQWGTAPDAGFIASEWNTLRADLGGALPDGTMDHLRQVDTQAWQIGERILFVPTFYASGLG